MSEQSHAGRRDADADDAEAPGRKFDDLPPDDEASPESQRPDSREFDDFPADDEGA